MTNFEDLKKKAKDAFDTITDVSVEAYKIAEEKAKLIAKSTVLSTEMSRERSYVRRLYLEIGRKYYEMHKDDPGEEFEQNCHAVTAALSRIAAKRNELEDLKKSGDLRDEDFDDVEFEPVPENDADSGSENTQTDYNDKSPDGE